MMEIQVLKERDNPFFKRKDLVLNIIHTGAPTPKTDDVKKELAKKYNVHVSQVVVDYIMTKSGLNESTAKVKILNERPPVVEEPSTEKATTEEASEEKETEPKKEEQDVKEDKQKVESNNQKGTEQSKEGVKDEAQTSETK